MPFKDISPLQHDAFVSSLRAGHYNLLLGAGASVDASNNFGLLPAGAAFKDTLCALKNVSVNYSLQRVYELLTPPEIDKYVTARFKDAVPGDTTKLISSFIWKRIFTWNLDDVLENTYNGGSRQKLVPLHFADAFVEADNLADLPLIYLHGSVRQADKGYVFSRNEYVNQIRNVSHWMVFLTQIMHTQPLIISGASLDEIDLDYYLSFRTPTASRDEGGPSILVEVADDAITQNMCKSHNLIQFIGYSNDFFSYCKKLLPNAPTPFDLLASDTRNLIPAGVSARAALAFQADFELVPATGERTQAPSRFQYGYAPSWHDLASDRDISRTSATGIVVEAERRVKDSANIVKIILVSASTGKGKTTLLRRVGFELSKRGIRTLLCTALNRFDRADGDIIDLMDGPVVLIVDNFADQAAAIFDLIDRVEKKEVLVIGTERSYRMKHILTLLGTGEAAIYHDLPLTYTEAVRLVQNYLSLGFLGDRRSLRDRQAFARRLTNDPIAIACCRIMNDFRPLDAIVRELIKETNEHALDRYLMASLAHECLSTGVRFEVLASSIDRTGLKEQFEADNPLPLAYLDRSRTFIIPENTTLGERVLDDVSRNDRKRLLKIFAALANGIASRVNRGTIIKGTPEARMSRRLFDYDDVVGPLLGSDADEFYDLTRESWRWNSRYWEQVALLNLAHFYDGEGTNAAAGFLDHAVQHARHAVTIERHPFPLSTLGKVLMTQMVQPGQPLASLYEEAFTDLQTAIEIERKWSRSAVQPYASLFSGTMRYLENKGTLSEKQRASLKSNLIDVDARFPMNDEIHTLASEVSRRL
ncbi:MAG TPA: SIR2 family protein [Stellaceae bacterium]|nr:SIR2 family protein [Stellaceae bacterium]